MRVKHYSAKMNNMTIKRLLILAVIIPLILSGCIIWPPWYGDEMGELTVKMTVTGGDNTWSNPANAQDLDSVYAEPTAQDQILHRTTGNHDGSFLGAIVKVELGANLNGDINNDYTWEGGFGVDNDNGTISVTPGPQWYYFDVTSVRTWTWADFNSNASLYGKIDNKVNTVVCDQLMFRVTYVGRKINDFNRISGADLL